MKFKVRILCKTMWSFIKIRTNKDTLNKLQDLFILLLRLRLFHQVNFVLQDNYVLQLHNFDSRQVFWCLRLWTRLVTSWNSIRNCVMRGNININNGNNVINGSPIKSKAASITAAPLSIVAIRMSCPGQSTKETWRTNSNLPWQTGRKQGNESSLLEPPDM